jgi:hypothetical protein
VTPFRVPGSSTRPSTIATDAGDERALAAAAFVIGAVGVGPSLLGATWGAQPTLAAVLLVLGGLGLLRGWRPAR